MCKRNGLARLCWPPGLNIIKHAQHHITATVMRKICNVVKNLVLLGCGLIFMLTGALKLIDALGAAPYLTASNSLFSFLTNGQTLLIAGSLELAVGFYALGKDNVKLRFLSIMWMCALLVVYKVGLIYTHDQVPCSCFGILSKVIPMTTHQTTIYSWVLLALLMSGATSGFIIDCYQHARQQSSLERAG